MIKQATKDTAQHIAGIVIGKLFGGLHSKSERGARWFSTVSANLAAQGVQQDLWIYIRPVLRRLVG